MKGADNQNRNKETKGLKLKTLIALEVIWGVQQPAICPSKQWSLQQKGCYPPALHHCSKLSQTKDASDASQAKSP